MIKLQNLTPEIYYQHSRDFQLLGHLYDIVLNNTETNADLLYNLPFNDDVNIKVLDLLAYTLGFSNYHNYNVSQLQALCSSFAEILKYKGSLKAIELACILLSSAEGLTDTPFINWENNNTQSFTLEIHVSPALSNINLLRDILDYILPAGISYNIIKQINLVIVATTKVQVEDNVNYSLVLSTDVARVIAAENTRPDISHNRNTDENPSEFPENTSEYYSNENLKGKIKHMTLLTKEKET